MNRPRAANRRPARPGQHVGCRHKVRGAG